MKSDSRTTEILEAIMALARLDFSHKIQIHGAGDSIAAIAAGVNMLGEELRENVVSLKEKEQLLKELHHRVKNNMQIIISMLKLQTINEDNERLLALVQDSQNRISAMALVHEMLYSTKDFVFTQLREYIEFLSASLFLSYAPPKHAIVLELEIDRAIYFEIDYMIPLGLIMNEMMSNSLKHAFPGGEGKIKIHAAVDETGWYTITYSDDGKGLPKDFDIAKSESLGTQLIVMLTEQLDGELVVKRDKGLSYSLRFM
ncbi:MAG: sensor histidine kinase [Bacteroidetes bacterium]|nr:sensor histidine kinase [Bacteroidota bacterium]